MISHTFAAPTLFGLALTLCFSTAHADKGSDSIDVRRLSFHPALIPQHQELSPAPPQLAFRLETRATRVESEEVSTLMAGVLMLPTLESGADQIVRYRQHISDLQAREGTYAPSLSEVYESLAKLYRQDGDMEAALESLQAAQQVVRASAGLNSPEQIPLLREMIATNLELGRVPAAHDLQAALLNLQQRHAGREELGFVPALTEWADWNVQLYLSQGVASSYEMNPVTGTLSYRNPLLQEAHARYVHALQILQQKETSNDDSRLVAIERKLAALNYIVSQESEQSIGSLMTPMAFTPGPSDAERLLERASTVHFLSGRSALERAVAYGYVVDEPDYDAIAARMMELGDWYLLFDRRSAALETYQEAMTLMSEAQLSATEADRIVAAGMPIQTPGANFFEGPKPRDYAGHIDVAFDLNKYGVASNTEILESSAPDPRIERELLRTIKAGKFRPKFKDGAVIEKDRVQLRYYYAVAGL